MTNIVMKASEMARIEALFFKDKGKSHEDLFMEAAGLGVYHQIKSSLNNQSLKKPLIIILCAKGNNSGDAYVVGRHFLCESFKVIALQVTPLNSASRLCQKNAQVFLQNGGEILAGKELKNYELPKKNALIIDGLLGTGFKGKLKEPFLELIKKVNNSRLLVYSIDIPSGLSGDDGLLKKDAEAICAKETIALGAYKTGFFLGDSWQFVGNLSLVDFGLPQSYLEKAKRDFSHLNFQDARSLLPVIKRNRHKYEAGLVTILAGSPGMSGAAILAAKACYRSGAGLVRLIYPEDIKLEMNEAPIECLRMCYDLGDPLSSLEQIKSLINDSKAVLIGPGLGMSKGAIKLVKELLFSIKVPLILDADALNIIAKESLAIPQKSILTPHLGEAKRLLNITHTPSLNLEFFDIIKAFAKKNSVNLLLKGGPSFIFAEDLDIKIMSCGDPGMATAGSGDVLAGIILALLGQGLEASKACSLGAYLHGRSGEIVAKDKTSFSLMAHDLIKALKDVFKELKE